MRPVIPALALVLTAVPAIGQRVPEAPFTVAETGERFATVDDAVNAIRDDRGTILIAPGVYRQCTVQIAGHVTFKAIEPGTVVFDGVACEDKAAFVLRGRSSVVDGIVFRNLRVPDGNGAGIRTEIGDLTVVNSMFLDSQEGILGGNPDGQRIRIDRSTFAGLGQCDETPDCAHSIYLGNEGSLEITRSRFERGRGGHYVKLRTPNVVIADSSFDDSAGRNTNYAIDLAEGARGRISGNSFVQGPNKENWTGFIVVGAEKRDNPSDGLRIEGNVAVLAPGQRKSPAFVAVYGSEQVVMADNRLGTGVRAFERR